MELTIRYIGEEPLEHRGRTWEPGEEKQVGDHAAKRLLHERPGDMKLVPGDVPNTGEKPTTKPTGRKPKGKGQGKAGGRDKAVTD